MRKWFAIVLICLLILSTLTGCTDRSKLSPDHPVMRTLWHVYGEQADSPMNRLGEEFNATVGQKMGILINVTNVTSASKIGGQLQAALSGEPDSPDMPDLFSAHTTTAMAMEPSSLVNWREYFTEEELESYVPEFLEDGTYDRSTFRSRLEAAEKELAELANKRADLERHIDERRRSDPRKAAAALENLVQLYPTMSPADKNSALKALGVEVTYTKEKKTKPRDFTLELQLRDF